MEEVEIHQEQVVVVRVDLLVMMVVMRIALQDMEEVAEVELVLLEQILQEVLVVMVEQEHVLNAQHTQVAVVEHTD